MDKATNKLIVFFEKPFWIGIFERMEHGNLSVAKVTFGAEPKDYEVYDFVLNHYYELRFSSSVSGAVSEKPRNPKRVQRELKKQLSNIGIGTKSKQALKLQQEQVKTERKQHSRELKESESQRQYELRQQKKKEKHRGR